MKKIITAVDISANSKMTIRFAIQMASQIQAEITFIHVVSVIAPTVNVISDYTYYAQFQKDDANIKQDQLIQLVRTIYDGSLPQNVKYTCVCVLGDEISSKIIDYATTHQADYICAGARDNDIMTRLFGSVANYLIATSPIPVMIVPRNYRVRQLQKICYATDMLNFEEEMETVIEMADCLSAKLHVIHINYEVLLKQNKEKLSEVTSRYQTENIVFQYKKLNTLFPLNDYLRKVVANSRPSILVLFVKQDRSWLDRIINSSKSAELSFTSNVPLLIFRKAVKK